MHTSYKLLQRPGFNVAKYQHSIIIFQQMVGIGSSNYWLVCKVLVILTFLSPNSKVLAEAIDKLEKLKE
jgi:hypothetical protein